MTSEKEELPTAAIEGVGQGEDNNFPHTVDKDISKEDAINNLKDSGWTQFNELVRRQDVEQLIKDLIEHYNEDHVEVMECEDESHDHELEEPMIVGRKQALEELLEEVQNQ